MPAKKEEPKKLEIDPKLLRRNRPARDEVDEPPPPRPVSAGPIDKVIELAYNPSREKIKEMTVIDRWQARLFPLMDTLNTMFSRSVLEVALYRQDKEAYKQLFKHSVPEPLDPIDDFLFFTAQWQKSRDGKNLQSAADLALAETETKGGDMEEPISGHGYPEE